MLLPPATTGGFHREQQLGAFSLVTPSRGFHPALENVAATDSDKRGESSLCLLGEHPSGQ